MRVQTRGIRMHLSSISNAQNLPKAAWLLERSGFISAELSERIEEEAKDLERQALQKLIFEAQNEVRKLDGR